MTKITTILFDLDGTLINTNDLIIQSFLHTLGKFYPDQYKEEDVLPFMGPTLMETFESIDKEKSEDMIREYRTFNIAHHDELVKEFDGVYETIAALKENGFKLGIVTTKMLNVVKMGLEVTRLTPFFEVIVALNHVTKAKPDPEPIRKALEQLQSTPEEAIMVGDNYHDILGGKNAGTKTAGVAWSAKGRAYLEEYHPDYILDHMSDLLEIVGARQR